MRYLALVLLFPTAALAQRRPDIVVIMAGADGRSCLFLFQSRWLAVDLSRRWSGWEWSRIQTSGPSSCR